MNITVNDGTKSHRFVDVRVEIANGVYRINRDQYFVDKKNEYMSYHKVPYLVAMFPLSVTILVRGY